MNRISKNACFSFCEVRILLRDKRQGQPEGSEPEGSNLRGLGME